MDGKLDKKILDVPHHSQFEIEDRYWMLRGCAIASLKMVLDYHGADTPGLLDLIKIGEKKGGYGPSGWYHDAIVNLAKDYGLESYREEGLDLDEGVQKIIKSLQNKNPVIVSTPKFILGRKKFHMVVVTGFEQDGDTIKGFYYHDPESTTNNSGHTLFVAIDTFKKEWRRMAIFIAKKD